MAFIVPAGLDWREEELLARLCLMQLYRQNREIFEAFVTVVLAEYRADVSAAATARRAVNEFETYVGYLADRLLDPPTRREQNARDIGVRDLTMAIWNHLEDRDILKGAVQDSMKQAIPYYESFARFIAIRTFGGRPPQNDAAATEAASRIIRRLGAGMRGVKPVERPNPFGPKAPNSCEP